MATSQITGVVSSLYLDTDNFTNPLTVTSTGTVTKEIYGQQRYDIVNDGQIAQIRLGGGQVTNEAGGTISGVIHAIGYGEIVVDNAGVISGGVTEGLRALVSNAAGGIIDGIFSKNASGSSILNFGTITGINLFGKDMAIENAGTMAGFSMPGYGSNRLILDPGGVFLGQVTAYSHPGPHYTYEGYEPMPGAGPGAGPGTPIAYPGSILQLNSGASTGTVDGLGSEYVGFPTIDIEKGAAWDIVGTKAGLAGENFNGFNTSDTLDLTDLAFDAADTATLNANHQLVIKDAGGNVTIQLDAGATGDMFALASDGNSGTLIENLGGAGALAHTVAGVTLVSDTYSSPLTIASTGTVTNGIYGATSWTIDNDGAIAGGVTLKAGWAVINEAGHIVAGNPYGILFQGAAGTVTNDGEISGAVGLIAGGSVTNDAGGTITGYVAADGLLTLDNAGAIAGGVSGAGGGTVTNESTGTLYGIDGTSLAVDNFGDIGAGGVTLTTGGAVTNESNGSIGEINALSVDNFGTVGGIYSAGGGSVTNEAGGTVTGVTLDGDSGTIVNHGAITGAMTAIVLDGDAGTIFNDGTIAGTTTGVALDGVNLTVENAGTIRGTAAAVYLKGSGSANRVIVDPGAVFKGAVTFAAAGGGAATLQLNGGSTGTITGFGTEYAGFKTIDFADSAVWNVKGAKAAFNGVTIDGFSHGDRLDLTDLAFNNADTATVNSGNQLVIHDTHGNVTMQLSAGFSGDAFGLSSDGNGGTAIYGFANAKTLYPGITIKSSGTVYNPPVKTINGIYLRSGTATNAGKVQGNLEIARGGVLTNESGGTVTGTVEQVNGYLNIYNSGLIGSVAFHSQTYSRVTNASTGDINGLSGQGALGYGMSVANYGTIGGAGISGGEMTITNAGAIGGTGISLLRGDRNLVTNMAGGTITGTTTGVDLTTGYLTNQTGAVIVGATTGVVLDDSTLKNQAGARITGTTTGVVLSDDGRYEIVENAGTIGGGKTAISAASDNAYGGHLIVDPGAVFNGNVAFTNRGDPSAFLQLNSGKATGTISGLGTKYTGFGTVVIMPKAAWDIAGTKAGFLGVTVDGFTANDALDITDLAFKAGATALLAPNNQLIVAEAAGTVTIAFDSGVTGDFFALAGDGHSGTLVKEVAPLVIKSGVTSSGLSLANGAAAVVAAGGSLVGAKVGTGAVDVVRGTASSTTVLGGGAEIVSGGGKSIGATVSSGGTETALAGGTASATHVKAGGTLVYGGGTVTGATVSSGGKAVILTGVTASGVSVANGATLTVSAGGTASKPTVAAGGTIVDLGHTLSATVAGTKASSGVLIVSSGGTAVGTILSGGMENVLSGGVISGPVTFKDTGDTLSITGTKPAALSISGFAKTDVIDLASFAAKSVKLSFAENGAKTSGTLTIADGALTAKITLFGNFTAAGFHATGGGAGGTDITYSISAAAISSILGVSHH